MATKLYLTNQAAPYTPATLRGAWDQTAQQVTKAIDVTKTDPLSGVTAVSTVTAAETSASNNFDVLLYRGVSGPMSAQTISGTLNVMIAVIENSASLNGFYHVHVYVTQGDSDTPRGTILTDYIDSVEFASGGTAIGQAFSSAQSLSSLAVSSGDRLVVEIGYQAQNTSSTSMNASLRYGAPVDLPDLTVGTNGGTAVGFLTFSGTITFNSQDARVAQLAAEAAVAQTTQQDARVAQLAAEVAVAQTNQQDARISQILVEVAIFNYSAVVGFPHSQVIIVG